MYDLPLLTIRELSADEYEKIGGVDFNDPEFRPMIEITLDWGTHKRVTVCLLEAAVMQHVLVQEP